MSGEDWNPDKFVTYRYVSDYAVITFTVPCMSDWSEEQIDSAAESDLRDYVTNPEDYYLDDCWDNNVGG